MLRHSTSDFLIPFSYINIRIQTPPLLTKGEGRQTLLAFDFSFFFANLLHPPLILDILSEEMLLLTHSSIDTTELKHVAGTLCFSLTVLKMFQSRDGEKYRTKYRGYQKIKITVLCQNHATDFLSQQTYMYCCKQQ